METDKHYFMVGLFIIGTCIAAAFFALWLAQMGRSDDILYRIHFATSVSGLAVGDPVKYRGVDVGTVETMRIDPDDPRLVEVDVRLRKEAPVKTDTTATLRLKGVTGVVFIELDGGDPAAPRLAAVTPKGMIPEIPSQESSMASLTDELPKVMKKFSHIENRVMKVLSDKNINQMSDTIGEANDLVKSIKEDPSQLVFGAKDEEEKKAQEGTVDRPLAPQHNDRRTRSLK